MILYGVLVKLSHFLPTGRWEGDQNQESQKTCHGLLIVRVKQFSLKPLYTYILLVAGILSTLPAWSVSVDTLRIQEVTIVEPRIKFYTEDIRIADIDTLIRQQNPFLNLGELLCLTNAVNIQSYGGAGSLASISIRGTGSSHTNVLWNGIPLNALTTGISDLSMIPVAPFTNISVVYGSSGSLYGAGAFGGSVILDHEPDWSNRLRFQTSIEGGSFGSVGLNFNLETGNGTIQYKLSPFLQSARNDFLFEDSEKPSRPVERRDHNFFQNYGAIQNLNIQLPKQHMVEFGLWYQVKYNQLPLPMGSYGQSQQSQTDSTLKIYMKWVKRFTRFSLEARTGYGYDFMRFVDRQSGPDNHYAIDSRISNKQLYFDFNARFYQLGRLTLDVGGNAALLAGYTNNYLEGSGKEYRANVVASAKYKLDLLTLNGSLRWHTDHYFKNKVLYSIGIRWPVIANRWILRAHMSNRYRLPSFNDRYWFPGGNVDLRPETGWGSDVGTIVEIFNTDLSKQQLQYRISVHSTHIHHWIQWIPSNGYWSPVNYKEIWARGLETGLYYVVQAHRLSMTLNMDYAYTKSTVQKVQNPDILGKEMQYVPRHLLKGHFALAYGPLVCSLDYQVTGKRFTTGDNDAHYVLEPFQTTTFSTGYTLQRKNHRLTLRFQLMNLMNEQYQLVRNYPMPGRSYHVGLQYKFND